MIDICAAGVRIFTDGRNPKDGQSLAVMRRGPRAARRRRDRFLQRQRGLDRLLRLFGLFPDSPSEAKALAALDPLRLRAEGLDRALTPHEFGRALWHLNQRRGFKSNRKTDGKDAESGVIKQAAAALDAQLQAAGARTIGAWLHAQRQTGARVRFSPTGEGKERYRFYPTRDMTEAEFDRLWAVQGQHQPQLLTDQARVAIRKMIFDQRPLKKPQIGKCTLVPSEPRAPKALPSVEARDIYERLNALRWGLGPITDRPLSREVRDALASSLLSGKAQSWDKVRKLLKAPEARFNLQDWLKELPIARTAKRMGAKDAFGAAWMMMPLDARDAVLQRFIDSEDEEDLAAWLVAEHGFAPDAAAKLAGSSTPGAYGYGKLGITATRAILTELIADHTAVYSTAVERAGWHHSDLRTGEVRDDLPFYGEVLERHVIDSDPNLRAAVAAFLADREANAGRSDGKPHARRFAGAGLAEARTGRVPNPTVHIGLNQLRLVVNALIKAYGPPDEIVIELARELKLTKEQKDRANQDNRKNRDANDRRKAAIEALGQPVNGETMMRARLFDAQMTGGVVLCPYSLTTISFTEAIGGGEIEVDHILPFSLSYDDSIANKVLVRREANRRKGRRTPHEAFGRNADWEAILANAEGLGKSRSWRFAPDALERFDKQGGFLERQLNETRHLARLAKAYLEVLTPSVWVVTGQLTALLRGKWGLNGILGDDNRKNRNDHRHHAIDAVVIGCTSRGVLAEVARVASRAEEQDLARLFGAFPEPMPDFRDKARRAVNAVVVSHKPEHGTGGALFKNSAYGINSCERDLDRGNLVYRRSLDELKFTDIKNIRDVQIRDEFLEIAQRSGDDEKAFKRAISEWAYARAAKENEASSERPLRMPIRRLRLLKRQTTSVVPISAGSAPGDYKALIADGNWCLDIVKDKQGSWHGFATTRAEINRKDWRPLWEEMKCGYLLVMRIIGGDILEIDNFDGTNKRGFVKVQRLEPSASEIRIVPIHETGDLEKRHKDPDDPFRWDRPKYSGLKIRNARLVRIDEIGRV